MYYVDLCTVCGLVDRRKKTDERERKQKINPWPHRSPDQQYFIHSISFFFMKLFEYLVKLSFIPRIDNTITMHEISLFYWTSFLKRH